MIVICNFVSAAAAFAAAWFWFRSAATDPPPMVTYWDRAPADDPFFNAIKHAARMNRWGAASAGVSALAAGLGAVLGWIS